MAEVVLTLLGGTNSCWELGVEWFRAGRWVFQASDNQLPDEVVEAVEKFLSGEGCKLADGDYRLCLRDGLAAFSDCADKPFGPALNHALKLCIQLARTFVAVNIFVEEFTTWATVSPPPAEFLP